MDKSTLLKIFTPRSLSTIEALRFSRELKKLEIEEAGNCERISFTRRSELQDIERGLIALKNLK